jgi:hypothetical protein
MTIYLYKKTHNMLEAAKKHKGQTWKLINGKRVWMEKETNV